MSPLSRSGASLACKNQQKPPAFVLTRSFGVSGTALPRTPARETPGKFRGDSFSCLRGVRRRQTDTASRAQIAYLAEISAARRLELLSTTPSTHAQALVVELHVLT